jgi:hypothetical protein
MDQELKQYLDANFGRIDERFAQVDDRLAKLATKKELEAAEERSAARTEKAETSLLGAFYSWARPMEIRVNGMTSTVMGFDERLALAEQRISELERKRAS